MRLNPPLYLKKSSRVDICKNLKINFTITRSTKTMLTGGLKIGTPAMLFAEQTFLNFCNHFYMLQKNQKFNQEMIIKTFKESVDKNDAFCNKAFQMALNVAYSHIHFDRLFLFKYFDKYFTIQNPLDPFDHTSDIDESTLCTILQSYVLKKYYPGLDVVIQQTPTSNIKNYILSSELQAKIQLSKLLTGNANSDILVNGLHYDYKLNKVTSNTENHVRTSFLSNILYRFTWQPECAKCNTIRITCKNS